VIVTLLDEMRAITAFIRTTIPGSTTAFVHPTKPVSGLFVVRHNSVASARVTAGVTQLTRTLQVVLYHGSTETAFEQMDALHRAIGNTPKITDNETCVEITSLSFGSPVKMETGLFGLVGTMGIRSHAVTEDAQKYGTEPLIAGVHATITE
jgi:hypothetical protein